jgi:hypothetical protein
MVTLYMTGGGGTGSSRGLNFGCYSPENSRFGGRFLFALGFFLHGGSPSELGMSRQIFARIDGRLEAISEGVMNSQTLKCTIAIMFCD